MKYFRAISILLISLEGYSQSPIDSSKKNYTLFKATPENLMREFSTDRPDATESPYTVDAGHFQFETDLFKIEKSHLAGTKSVTYFYNDANLRLGITHSLDLQFLVTTFSTTTTKEAGTNKKQSVFGGLTIRAKQNLWGNDQGSSAFGILPFVNIPANSVEKFSGGIVFPFALALAKGWGLGAQVEVDINPDPIGNPYHFDYLFSATLSHSIIDHLEFFTEGVVVRNNEIKIYEYFLNGGIIYSLSKNVNFDTGIYYGFKEISSQTFFVGLSFRM